MADRYADSRDSLPASHVAFIEALDGWFPFGSDGGGEMLCFDLAACSDKVFWIPYIGMSEDEAMEQPFNLTDIAAAIHQAN